MALSKERIGEIAMVFLQSKLEQDGIRLNPKEIKREIINGSKKFGFTPQEIAEFIEIVIKTAYEKTMVELGEIKTNKTGKVEE